MLEGQMEISWQRFVRRRESYARFLPKMIALGLVMAVGAWLFGQRFGFALDTQSIRCIPGYRLYLLDFADREPARDKIFALSSPDLSPIYPEGTKLLKYLRGMPGDQVAIEPSLNITVAGRFQGYGLKWAQEKLGRAPESFVGSRVLGDDQFWWMGTSAASFDSRYWGATTRARIIARAYPLF